MEKLVDIVQFLHLEIHKTFGRAGIIFRILLIFVAQFELILTAIVSLFWFFEWTYLLCLGVYLL